MIPAWSGGRLCPLDKLDVHRRGLRHKAVSVFVIDGGATLLQRRAIGKYHSGGLWANACCTHPRWGESDRDCARRRLREELGITGLEPVARGMVEYRADVGGGLTEHEVVALFVAEAGPGLAPAAAPAEVDGLRWVGRDALRREIAANPSAFSPWLRVYLEGSAGRIYD
jgi:isopentenyl-diphosphate delta-isomerase